MLISEAVKRIEQSLDREFAQSFPLKITPNLEKLILKFHYLTIVTNYPSWIWVMKNNYYRAKYNEY